MLKNPPASFILPPENFFRRKQREVAFYFTTTFKLHALHFILSLLIILFFSGVSTSNLIIRFEYIFLDYFFRMRSPIQKSSDIVYINMAEDSLRVMGRWPWPRHYHAALTRILHEWGARAIVFDIIFSEHSNEFDDGSLEEAFKEAGNVYLPVMFEALPGKKQHTWIHSLPEFEKHAKGVGHINVFPSRDGLLRRITPFLRTAGESYPYLALKAGFDYLGKSVKSPKEMDAFLEPDDRLLINWAGTWREAFQHISFVDLIKSYANYKEGRTPLIQPEQIRGKICLLGLTAAGLTDIRANSLEPSYPALGIQANVLNGIITQQYLKHLSPEWNRLALIVLGIFASLLFLFSRNVTALLASLCLGILWVRVAFLLFSRFGIWINVMSPLLLLFSLFVFSAIFSLATGKKEQEKLFDLAAKDGLTGLYVIRHFRNLMNDAVAEAYKKQQRLSLMILDIDFFKKINDTYGHEAGDVALKHVAAVLKMMTTEEGRPSHMNVVCRYGGEEFIIMLKDCHLIDAAFNYGEKIRRYFEKNPCEFRGMKIPLTVSIGVAALRSLETVPDLMVHRADEALYRAKAEGRNRTCLEEKSEDVIGGAPDMEKKQ